MNNRWQTITLHFFRARPLGNALYIADWLLTGRQIECLNCDEEWLLCYFMVLYFTLLQCIGAPSGNVQAIHSLRCSLIHPSTYPLTWLSLRHVLLYLKKTTCYVCVCVCRELLTWWRRDRGPDTNDGWEVLERYGIAEIAYTCGRMSSFSCWRTANASEWVKKVLCLS